MFEPFLKRWHLVPDGAADGEAACPPAASPAGSRYAHMAWILAWTGLSAAWILGDGDAPFVDLAVAELALSEIDA